ncbi:MAG: DoxX family protein [Cytophagales bacterium]|nr:MAG: DoxX family protein [Cytophagales bacterium]
MKYLLLFCRIFVGCLFIFSGIIKLNDPVGTQIKLEEYFEVFGTHFMIPFALFLSVLMCVAEVALGFALLFYYRMKWTTTLLLLLILFFTFLTFYSAFFNKVTDCGCFGDFLKLKPWTSFTKDIVLLIFILPLFYFRKQLSAGFDNIKGDIIVGSFTFMSLAFALYCIAYLNVWDFRAYKIGNNIPTLMKPTAAPIYQYIMTKDGKDEFFDKYPTDTTYIFKEMKLTNPELATPKITDYNLWSDEGDFTQKSFEGNKLLIVVLNTQKSNTSHIGQINSLLKTLENSNIEPVAITSSDRESFENFRHDYNLAIPYYYADGVVIKTMIRSIPGLILMKNGTVVGKWSHNAIPSKEELQKLL